MIGWGGFGPLRWESGDGGRAIGGAVGLEESPDAAWEVSTVRTILIAALAEASHGDLTATLSDFDVSPSELGIEHGIVMARGAALVFVSVLTPARAGLGASQRRGLADELGADPTSVFVLDVGHGEGADELASSLATRLIEQYRGVLVDDDGIGGPG